MYYIVYVEQNIFSCHDFFILHIDVVFRHGGGVDTDEPLKFHASMYFSRTQFHESTPLYQLLTHTGAPQPLVEVSQDAPQGSVMLLVTDLENVSVASIIERYCSMNLKALIIVTEQRLSHISSEHMDCSFPIILVTVPKHDQEAIMAYICKEGTIPQVQFNIYKRAKCKGNNLHLIQFHIYNN